MDEPILTMEEREAINGGRWFSTLSPSLRHDILLCAVPDISERIDGTSLDLVRPIEGMRLEETATTVLFVLKVGPDAYNDTAKFPNGAWCKEGDFVLVRTYSGTRFKIFGKEFRLINDDQVDAVVQDPRGLTRA